MEVSGAQPGQLFHLLQGRDKGGAASRTAQAPLPHKDLKSTSALLADREFPASAHSFLGPTLREGHGLPNLPQCPRNPDGQQQTGALKGPCALPLPASALSTTWSAPSQASEPSH